MPVIFEELVADLINRPLILPSSTNPFLILHVDSGTIYLLPHLKNFVGKLKELKLGLEVCRCNVCAS